MSIIKIEQTKAGYKVKNIIINETKTVLIGKVQDLNNPDVFISTKWTIDRENKVAISQRTDITPQQQLDGVFDLCLKNIYIESFQAPVVRNFYSFHKDAWHCKLYKWVFGKDAWKVHKTMCPYWWTMIVVILFIWLICIFKLGGRWSQEMMESLRTYQERRREAKWQRKADADKKIRQDFMERIKDPSKLTTKEAFEITESSGWNRFRYDINSNIFSQIMDLRGDYRKELWELEEIEAENQRKLLQKQTEQKIAKTQKREHTYTEFKENIFTKVIGMLLVIVISFFILYVIAQSLVALFNYIPWLFLGKILLWVAAFVASVYVLYLFIKFVAHPVLKFISHWVYVGGKATFKFIGEKTPKVKLPKNKTKINLNKIIHYLFGWVVPVMNYIARFFISIFNFFVMSKDLIYSIYKKNCPTITWLDEEDNTNN